MKNYEEEARIPHTGRWTEAEHESFMIAMKLYGKQWKPIAKFIGTRSSTQVRSHAQKYYLNLENVRKRNEKYRAGEGKECEEESTGAGAEIFVRKQEADMVSIGVQTGEDTQHNKMDAGTQGDNVAEHTSCSAYTCYQVYIYN